MYMHNLNVSKCVLGEFILCISHSIEVTLNQTQGFIVQLADLQVSSCPGSLGYQQVARALMRKEWHPALRIHRSAKGS